MKNELKQAQKEWDIESNYDRNAIESVYHYNLQWRKENPNQYPYNREINNYIIEKENIPEELKEHLKTEVYLSQGQIEREKEIIKRDKMIKNGWIELTEKIVKQALKENKKIQLSAEAQNDWMTVKIDNVYKPKVFNEGTDKEQIVLMKPKARTRGYLIQQFDNAYCRLV